MRNTPIKSLEESFHLESIFAETIDDSEKVSNLPFEDRQLLPYCPQVSKEYFKQCNSSEYEVKFMSNFMKKGTGTRESVTESP